MNVSAAMAQPVDLGAAALDYATKGLPVFPCDPATKQPFTGHGFKNASNDPATVKAWWCRYPDAMIGIPTGEASKAWVLDVDDPVLFERSGLSLPATRRCETGKGYHLYFRHDPTVRNSQVVRKNGEKRWPFPDLPGAEVRGEGGYVIVPPSLHPTGRRYAWTDDLPIVEAPSDLLRIVRKQSRATSGAEASQEQTDTSWGLAALEAECANVRSAGNGEQEGTLNNAALKIGGIVAGGSLLLATARREMIAAGLAMPSFNPRDEWTPHGVVAKIERGLQDGAASPRAPAGHMRFGPRASAASARPGSADFDPDTGEVFSTAPDPMDLWAHYSAPALPTGLLPDVIERFARKHGEVMGADPAGLAMAALTVCATAISDTIVLQVKKNDPTWKESARLWVALVGPPSRKKSPIFKAAMRPLRRIDSNLMSDYLAKLSQYEALPNDQRKAAPRPKQKRLLISDATVEAAQEVMKDSPDGILSEQDELSGWFGAMDKFASGKGSQADRAFYLKSYNGGTYNLNRIGRGAVQIPNLSINLLGGIQPEPLRKIANDTVDDGLIQRLLPVILRHASVGRDVPADGVIVEYERLIESLNLMKSPQRGVIADEHHRALPVRFDDRARSIRERLEVEHLALVEALETVSPKLAAHYGKFDGLFARLCLVWHCIENAEAVHAPPEVHATTAERVAKFMEQFIRPSAVAFYAGMLGVSAGHEELVALAAWIVAKGPDEVGARDAQRSTQSLRHLTADEVRTLCEKLESFGWLERGEPAPKSNTPRWIVNPRVHEQFGDRAAVEQQRRGAAREALRDALQV